MFLTSLKQTCNEYLIKFSENQSAPKLENRKTSPCSPCAPNLLHVLVSRILGYRNICSPVFDLIFLSQKWDKKQGLILFIKKNHSERLCNRRISFAKAEQIEFNWRFSIQKKHVFIFFITSDVSTSVAEELVKFCKSRINCQRFSD